MWISRPPNKRYSSAGRAPCKPALKSEEFGCDVYVTYELEKWSGRLDSIRTHTIEGPSCKTWCTAKSSSLLTITAPDSAARHLADEAIAENRPRRQRARHGALAIEAAEPDRRPDPSASAREAPWPLESAPVVRICRSAKAAVASAWALVYQSTHGSSYRRRRRP